MLTRRSSTGSEVPEFAVLRHSYNTFATTGSNFTMGTRLESVKRMYFAAGFALVLRLVVHRT